MQIWHAGINDVIRSLEITGLIGIGLRIVASKHFLGCALLSLGLLFYAEDGGDIFLRNFNFYWTAWRYAPEDRTLHSHRCENLKSKILDAV
jgi:hypothetical protein